MLTKDDIILEIFLSLDDPFHSFKKTGGLKNSIADLFSRKRQILNENHLPKFKEKYHDMKKKILLIDNSFRKTAYKPNFYSSLKPE